MKTFFCWFHSLATIRQYTINAEVENHYDCGDDDDDDNDNDDNDDDDNDNDNDNENN